MTDPPPKPRRFRLTPGRLVVALLALEGFLLLSERFQWFAFDRHKGWTMLICLAAVGAAFLLMLLWFVAALVFRRRFQFSIRSLLLLVVVVAIPCSWLATEMNKARKQREAVEEVLKVRGEVWYDYQLDPSGCWIPGATPPGPPWLHALLGDDPLVDVTQVALFESEINDAWPEHLKPLTKLVSLRLYRVPITDAGLAHLKWLPNLRCLDIGVTKVTDAGLKHLEALPNLESLKLEETNVTDAGLKHLKGLLKLKSLCLSRTRVTGVGLEDLAVLPDLRELDLGGAPVTNAGLARLKELRRLDNLHIGGPWLTDEGLADRRIDATQRVGFIRRREDHRCRAGTPERINATRLALPVRYQGDGRRAETP